MAKESPRRRSAREKREAERETAPTAPAEPPTGDPPEETPTGDGASGVDLRRWALPAAAVVAIGVVAAVIIAIVAGNGGSTEVRTVTEKEEVTVSAKPVSDTEPSSGFDMAKCLRTEVTVPQGENGEKTVKKSKEFCEAQDELYGRSVGDDLGNTEFKSHHAENGAVVFGGWIGKTPVEQLRSLYRWSREDPVVAAMVLGCYSKDTYDQDVLASYRTAKPGSPQHQMAVRGVYTILTNPETSFNNFLLYGKTWNEGVTEDGTMTQSSGSFDGEPSTQVTHPSMVMPDGQVIPANKSKQLHRCINCQRTTTVPGVPVTPEPGVIPPGGGEETPGPSPEPEPTTPEGGEEAPGTETTRTPPPPPQEKPKTDTPSNDKGPSGTGKYQPPSETEPPSEPSSPSSNGPPPAGTTSPHPPPPPGTSPPPGGQAPPAENGGETGNPAGDY